MLTYVVVIFKQNSIDGRLWKLLWTFQNCYISSFSTYFIFLLDSHGGAVCAFFAVTLVFLWLIGRINKENQNLRNLRNFSLLKTQIKITSSTLFTKKINKNCEVNSNFQKKNVKVFFRIWKKKSLKIFYSIRSRFFKVLFRDRLKFDLIPIFLSSFLSYININNNKSNFSSKNSVKNNSFYKIKITSTNNWVLIKNDCKVEEWIWNWWKIYYDCM